MAKPPVNPDITLRCPVTVDGLVTSAITLRRPRVRDMLHAEKLAGSTAQQEIALFATLAGVAPAVIEELDLFDYKALQTAYQGFLS